MHYVARYALVKTQEDGSQTVQYFHERTYAEQYAEQTYGQTAEYEPVGQSDLKIEKQLCLILDGDE